MCRLNLWSEGAPKTFKSNKYDVFALSPLLNYLTEFHSYLKLLSAQGKIRRQYHN